MFSAIRRRATYANVAMTVALVFAMSGGAFAAGKYLITSTKQISPKVLKSLQGKAGVNGANGAAGPAGPAGTAGAAGPQGPVGPTGKEGPAGAKGEPGTAGKNGTSGFTATLPKGKTETGQWSFAEPVTGTKLWAPISFAIPLEAELDEAHVHFVTVSGVKPAQCPGSYAKPEAEQGNLCVYEGFTNGVGTEAFLISDSAALETGEPQGAGTSGTVLILLPNGEEVERTGMGSWAVTAE